MSRFNSAVSAPAQIEQLEKSLDRRAPAIDASLRQLKPAAGFAPQPLRKQQQPAQQAADSSQSGEPGSKFTDSTAVAAADNVTGSQQQPRDPNRCPNLLIKGNISAKGDRIYHMPGSRSYVSTQIDTKQGERYFCSEAEAQAAGWRAARS